MLRKRIELESIGGVATLGMLRREEYDGGVAAGATEGEREGAGVEGRESERAASSVIRRALSICSKRRLRSVGSKVCDGDGRRGGWWL